MNAPYPWLGAAWRDFKRSYASETLSHAYLISGPPGLGKQEFSEILAATILCEAIKSVARPCKECRGCTLFESNSHPDLKRIGPENGSKSIVIDQIRDLTEFYRLKSHYLGYKIGLIHAADSMNTSAANAILKTLEEPPPLALLILVSDRPGLLPATIMSRCHDMHIRMPCWEETEKWLAEKLKGKGQSAAFDRLTLVGAPLDVIKQIESGLGSLFDDVIDALDAIATEKSDVFKIASDFASVDIEMLIEAIETIVQSLVLLYASHRLTRLRLSESRFQQLQKIANNLEIKYLFYFLDEIRDVRTLVLRSSGLRSNEIMESLFAGWQRVTSALD